MTEMEFVTRLVIGLGCGVAVGLERQWRQRMAGLRTTALVATGACLFVILSAVHSDASNADRIAAQVVSGVGFLGAGVIIRDGLGVRGLNTAATLWCAAGAEDATFPVLRCFKAWSVARKPCAILVRVAEHVRIGDQPRRTDQGQPTPKLRTEGLLAHDEV